MGTHLKKKLIDKKYHVIGPASAAEPQVLSKTVHR
jgi:hypothetical protein